MTPIHFPNADLSYLRIYDKATIQLAFDSIAHESAIEFNFPQGSCQQRAQMMSMLLARKFNLDHCKVWLFPPAALYVGDERTLFIQDKNGLTPNNRIEWNFHVAPVVQMQCGDEVNTMVIDPSINSTEPMPLSKWFAAIGNSHVSKYSFLLPDKYFFYCCYTSNNIITTLFDGTFFDYDYAVKNDLSMEKGLALNDMAIKIFHTYIKPLTLLENDADKIKLEDLKAIFGNTTALDNLFSQNISGSTINTTLRYVISHYGDIFNEAKIIFYERLRYWTKFANELL